jgi:omega-6 fatty acid desaturase (delta-12 desaturase)
MQLDSDTFGRQNFLRSLSEYSQASSWKAIWQLLNTLTPYFALWGLMVYLLQHGYSYWVVVPFAALAACFLVRIFIFFHDCCHGSFFSSRRWNRIVGYVTGVLTFTPFEAWQKSHATHHATAGDLDRRGVGDVWTMTVDEYMAASKSKRFLYRLFRNPFIMFGLIPVLLFVIYYRFSEKGAEKKERQSVIVTNLAILVILLAAYLTIGLRLYFLIQIPVMTLAGTMGVWLFYVQHQYENVYWSHHEKWDPFKAGLQGSSYYRLPSVLQWLTGNIGLHHIHHIRPRIPNYNLQRCYSNTPVFQEIEPITLGTSLKSLWLKLWDEKRQKLVSFRSLKASGS